MYEIKRLNAAAPYPFAGAFDPAGMAEAWAGIGFEDINEYPWFDVYPERFPCSAACGWNDKGLFLLMYACESPIMAKETEFGGMPCMDSCVEFFFSPFPEETPKYINVEINPRGVCHVGVGNDRYGRKVYKNSIGGFEVTCSEYDGRVWAVSCLIPWSLVMENFGKIPAEGDVIKGNFYKCSGPELHEHYGCWKKVLTQRPDYHRPEYFGEMVLK
ncbi:MAG: carbohydrate-binding family 9-like protein [Clostridia bacterium]|nr:carbohydrate-binding family 9-like protein [Clostridia bacterium]MBR6008699.1 carbohydrate-binding family 9-like protein [Clostridia bacterium]